MVVRKSILVSSRRSVRLLMPVVTGLILIGSAYYFFTNNVSSAQPEVKEVALLVSLPVPVSAVKPGTRLKDVPVQPKQFLSASLPPNVISDFAPMGEAVALTALDAGMPISFEKVSLTEQAKVENPILKSIPEGFRAITIRVDAASSVEGWAGSGARVDVILVEADKSSVIAQDVKVLSAERNTNPVQGKAPSTVPSTVTLLGTQDQALAISLAATRGQLKFALRAQGDDGVWNQASLSVKQLNGDSTAPSKSVRPTGFMIANGKKYAVIDGKWMEWRPEYPPEGFLATSPLQELRDPPATPAKDN